MKVAVEPEMVGVDAPMTVGSAKDRITGPFIAEGLVAVTLCDGILDEIENAILDGVNVIVGDCDVVTVGVAVGVAVAVGTTLGVEVGVTVAVGVMLGVGDALATDVKLGVAVGVAEIKVGCGDAFDPPQPATDIASIASGRNEVSRMRIGDLRWFEPSLIRF